MKQQINTPCGKPIRYVWKTPHKFLEKFSKNLYGTTGGTYSSRFLRPVMVGCKQAAYKPHTGRRQAADRQHTGSVRAAYRPHTGCTQGARRPHTDRRQAAHWPHTGCTQLGRFSFSDARKMLNITRYFTRESKHLLSFLLFMYHRRIIPFVKNSRFTNGRIC